MWTRAMIKGYAKQELKYSYWLSFAVCLVAGILGGGSGYGGGKSSSVSSVNDSANYGNYDATVIIIGIIIFLFAIAYSIFVSAPIEVGKNSFFIRAPYGDRNFSNLFSSFKQGRYMSIVKTSFMTGLFIFLWSLLLFIPGIIKAYQYRMVGYIISEDPTLTPKQAMELSRHMTDGEKWRMFVLDLSFIGWVLLAIIPLGLGLLFLAPYFEATWTQLYFALRQKVMAPTPDNYQQPQPQPDNYQQPPYVQ